VRKHHGFRRSGCSRRVDEGRDRVRLLRGNPLLELRLGRVQAELQELAPRIHARGVRLALHQHDRLETRESATNGEEFCEMFLVLDEGHRRLAVICDVFALLGRARRVDPRGHRTGVDGADVREEPFGAVVPDDADALTRLRSDAHESAGDLAHLMTVLVPGGRPPSTVALHPQRRAWAMRAHRALEDIRDAKLLPVAAHVHRLDENAE
jgi:hypothetical protein